MSKKFLSLLILSTIISSVAFSQSLHLGIKGGANVLKIDGKSFEDEFKFAYNLGVFAEIGGKGKWGVQPEILWNQTNFRTDTSFNNALPNGLQDFKGKLNYLAIPILLSFKPSNFITFHAGPQFGILLNKDDNLFENGTEAFKSGDFSMLGGIQLNLRSLKVGGRYVVGLTNIKDIDDSEKWKNQGFQLYVGFRII